MSENINLINDLRVELFKLRGQLRTIESVTTIGTWRYEIKNKSLSLSQGIKKILSPEISTEEFENLDYDSFTNLIIESDRIKTLKEYDDSINKHKAVDTVFRVKIGKRDLWVRSKYFTTYNITGKPLITEGTWQDVTADINAQKREERNEEHLNWLVQAFNESPVSIVITDADGNIEFVNPAFTHNTGYTAKEAMGENPRVLKSGEHNDKYYKNLWETISSGKVWAGELINKAKDGSIFKEKATISPITNNDGKIIRYLAVKDNITELSQLQNQVAQKHKMEAIGQLAGGVAHDFNNILTAIHGHADIAIANTSANNNIYDELLEIVHSADRASNLTHQLLTFSRKEKIHPKIINANTQIMELKKMVSRLIPEDIAIKFDILPAPAPILVDPNQFEQVIINLIVNAIDALRATRNDRKKRIVLKTDLSKDKKSLILSIRDNGCGIDSAIKEHIFEPFFTTKGKDKGTGLGLSTIYGIVNQNHAEISVSSKTNIGTTFKINWPISCGKIEKQKIINEKKSNRGGDETILFVEDDNHIRKLIKKHLSSLGYNVISATDGLNALELIEEEKSEIALLFTDVIMPLLDGKRLAKEMRKMYPKIPVLYASGYLDTDDGPLDENEFFIGKPYKINEIGSKIREILDR